MAAKGSIAKDNAMEKIAQAFGQNWIGIYDKKGYIWSEENGEKVQIAISLTCPKVQVGAIDSGSNALDFENMGATIAAPTEFQPAEISDQERDNIAKLMAQLGL